MANKTTFTIPSGATGAAVAAADLGRCFGAIVLRCLDTDGIDTAQSITALVGMEAADTLAALWLESGVGIWQSGTLTAADDGTIHMLLPAAMGVRRIRLVLSGNATADVVWTIYGLEPMDD